jgi:hypothetical protein
MELPELAFFLGSCVFGSWITANVILKGQLSLVTCLSFTYFLLFLLSKAPIGCAFCLSVLLQIKPPLFLPLLLYIVGCSQFRIVIWTVLFSAVFLLPPLFFLWPHFHVLLDYGWTLNQFMTGHWQADTYFKYMINLRSLFENLFSGSTGYFFALTQVLYWIFTLFCLVWARWFRRTLEVSSVVIVMLATLFFSVYTPVHDALLLLPVGVVLTALLRQWAGVHWLFVCYLCTGYALPNIWGVRLALIMFGVGAFYWAMTERRQASQIATYNNYG